MATCALVGASEFNAELFCAMDAEGAFDAVIAVDGGLAHLEAIGRKPDLALGDFDSLGYVPKGMRVAHFSRAKDKSDMDLALRRAKSERHTELFVFGGLGGRLDHTLANLQVMAGFCEKGLRLTAYGMNEAITFLTGPDILELPAQESGTISVFSLSDVAEGVFERGLLYEIDDVTLTSRTSQGLSNEFKGEAVMVGVEKGTLAIIVLLDEE